MYNVIEPNALRACIVMCDDRNLGHSLLLNETYLQYTIISFFYFNTPFYVLGKLNERVLQ